MTKLRVTATAEYSAEKGNYATEDAKDPSAAEMAAIDKKSLDEHEFSFSELTDMCEVTYTVEVVEE